MNAQAIGPLMLSEVIGAYMGSSVLGALPGFKNLTTAAHTAQSNKNDLGFMTLTPNMGIMQRSMLFARNASMAFKSGVSRGRALPQNKSIRDALFRDNSSEILASDLVKAISQCYFDTLDFNWEFDRKVN